MQKCTNRSAYVESKHHAISATKQSGAELSVECLCVYKCETG